MSLHADVAVEAPRQSRDGVEVETVALITIRIGVFRREVEEIRVSEGEGIAFVGIVVAVARESVIGVEQESVAHALAQTDRETTIERLGGADGIRNGAKVGKRRRHT